MLVSLTYEFASPAGASGFFDELLSEGAKKSHRVVDLVADRDDVRAITAMATNYGGREVSETPVGKR